MERPSLEEDVEDLEDPIEDETPKKGKRKRRTVSDEGLYFSSPTVLPRFSSGCILLDCVLGGGWALSRISNIVGDKSVGKSLLAIEACVNFLKAFPNGKIFYVETEAAFDTSYAQSLGLPLDKVVFPNNDENPIETIEALFEFLENALEKSSEETLVIIDSLDAISDESELAREIGEGSFGAAKAKKLSELFRRLNQKISKKKFAVLIVSQVRDAIGVMFGKKQTRSGGKALDFYASQIIWLSNMGRIVKTKKKIKRAIGVKVKAKCEKNKVGLPFRDCEFPIYFNYGVEDVIAGLEFLKSIDINEFDGKDVDSLLSSLEKMSDLEYAELRDSLSSFIVTTWDNVDRSFDRGRKKY